MQEFLDKNIDPLHGEQLPAAATTNNFESEAYVHLPQQDHNESPNGASFSMRKKRQQVSKPCLRKRKQKLSGQSDASRGYSRVYIEEDESRERFAEPNFEPEIVLQRDSTRSKL
jgi:hypothetical protein